MIHIILAALGLSTILAKSILLFNIIKWIGTAYLFYLGIKTILDKSKIFDGNSSVVQSVSLIKIYKQGLLTNLMNPKVALFFLSLIPQFINAEFVNSPVPFLILGFTFLFTGMAWCFILASAASVMTNTLRKNYKTEQLMKKISGIVFVALGIKLLVNEN